MSYRILHVLCSVYATKLYYNIASRAAQSNSVYVSALKIPIVQADGDCLFRSIVRQVSKLAHEEPGLVCEHLQTLGLLKGEDQDTLTLRKLFVDAVLADNCGISNFIQGSREELVGKAIEFQTRGFFDQEIGDVVISVCSNLLRIAIMVVTSSTTIPFLSFHCDQPLTNSPVFVAYHYYGAGHYDATESLKKGKRWLEQQQINTK